MVNLYGSTAAQEVVLLLDVEDETIWKYDEIHEEGIRIAASLISRCIQSGIPVGVRTNGRDQKTGECFHLEVGSGRQQVRLANEGLSRIDLVQKPDKMEFVLTRERESMDHTHRTYVMISKNQRISCYEGFKELLHQGAGGIWIATLYKEMNMTLPMDSDLSVIRWEVKK